MVKMRAVMEKEIALIMHQIVIVMGVRPQTHLGGTKFLPEKFVTAMTSPKKKKKVIACFAAPFSLLLA